VVIDSVNDIIVFANPLHSLYLSSKTLVNCRWFSDTRGNMLQYVCWSKLLNMITGIWKCINVRYFSVGAMVCNNEVDGFVRSVCKLQKIWLQFELKYCKIILETFCLLLTYPVVMFEITSIIFKWCHQTAPQYLQELCILVTASTSRRYLRSAACGDLQVLACYTSSFGPRSFAASAPKQWNSLPPSIRDPTFSAAG